MINTALTSPWMEWPETRTLMKALSKHGGEFRFVGGCVRDTLLKRNVQDVDLATSLKPETATSLLKAAGIAALPTGIKHGTITAVVGRRHFEITTLRRDTYCDGRHAQVEFTDDWKEDASRRDFTMNALYLSFSGELTDYFKGAADAKAGRVRFIGDADARIKEDYLRILRFFRFFAHYGKPPADGDALSACARHAGGMKGLSGERIRHEMLKLLRAQNPVPALQLMQEKEILVPLLGGATGNLSALERLCGIETLIKEQAEPETRLALIILASSVEKIAQRWKLSGATSETLEQLFAYLPDVKADLPITGQKKLLRKIGLLPFKQLVLMSWAVESNTQAARAFYQPMLALAGTWTPPEFPVSGDDLKARGVGEGKPLGDMLRCLEARWEESDYTLTKEELLTELKPQT